MSNSVTIENGAGSGHKQKVGPNNRAHVHSITETESVHSAETGDAYNLNTGMISMSADGTLIYYKNNDDSDFIIEAIALGSFEGITHSDDPYITVIKNPSGGDLITDESAVAMNQNRNFGSAKTLVSDVYKGKSAGTITGGSDIAFLQASAGGRSFYNIDFIVPKGSSMAIKLTLNASSGSANWYCALIGHLKDADNQ